MSRTYYKHNVTASGSRRKVLPIILAVLVLSILAGGTYLYVHHRNNQAAVQKQKAQDEAQTNSAKKSVGSKVSTSKTGSASGNSDKTSDQIPTSTNLTATISLFSQADHMVNAAATINTSQAGTCVISFTTDGSKPVSKTVDSTNTGNSQQCSVSINEVEFDKLGTWNLSIIFYTSDNTKVEASREVTIS